MSDDLDIAAEREQIARDDAIRKARETIPIHARPYLGCEPCSGITQAAASASCPYYRDCLADWERDHKTLNKQQGK